MSLKIEKENVNIGIVALMMFVAYAFSVGVRFIWVYYFSGDPNFVWNGEIMINTNDGYFFANAVKSLVEGFELTTPRELNPMTSTPAIVYVSYYLVKFTSLSLETVILYMPAFVASLIVVPIILIARLFRYSTLGFFAALIGSITWSYYNRTMVGYYDSDMFALLFPFIILYFVFACLIKNQTFYALLGGLSIALFPFFYPQGLTIIFATLVLFSIYVLVYKKDNINSYQSIVLLFIGVASLPIYSKIGLLISAFIVFKYLIKDMSIRSYLILSVFTIVAAAISTSLVTSILNQALSYVHTGVQSGSGLAFFDVKQTIREAGSIPFETLANRISGSRFGFFLAAIGYIFLLIHHRKFFITLALVGVGIFAFWGGLRFTVYAVPIAAISVVYLFYIFASKVSGDNKLIKYGIVTILSSIILYTNIDHVMKYKVPTVFYKHDVSVLDQLSKISSRKDYTLSWWDYGYPIWFYSNTHTLIDGGKHDHDNFLISKMLTTSSQTQAANLARLSVETYESSNHKVAADVMFKHNTPDQIDVSAFLKELKDPNYVLPTKTRDIYLYLPQKMLRIFPTVSMFSSLDLNSGTRFKNMFFYASSNYKDNGRLINIGPGVHLDKNKGTVSLRGQEIAINKMVFVGYDKGKLFKKEDVLNSYGSMSVVFLSHQRTFLLVDAATLDSLFFKLFLFEEYDKNLFELVISKPYAKVYKLKK